MEQLENIVDIEDVNTSNPRSISATQVEEDIPTT
jgi:hypothetical protein